MCIYIHIHSIYLFAILSLIDFKMLDLGKMFFFLLFYAKFKVFKFLFHFGRDEFQMITFRAKFLTSIWPVRNQALASRIGVLSVVPSAPLSETASHHRRQTQNWT